MKTEQSYSLSVLGHRITSLVRTFVDAETIFPSEETARYMNWCQDYIFRALQFAKLAVDSAEEDGRKGELMRPENVDVPE